jgi:hypothetical protein
MKVNIYATAEVDDIEQFTKDLYMALYVNDLDLDELEIKVDSYEIPMGLNFEALGDYPHLREFLNSRDNNEL